MTMGKAIKPRLVAIDFEFYYVDKSTKKPADRYTIKQNEYGNGVAGAVNDKRFELLLTTVMVDGKLSTAVGLERSKRLIEAIDWANAAAIAHNVRVEAYILHKLFGVHPKFLVCTMSMARATGLHIVAGGAGLEDLTSFLYGHVDGIVHKGDAVKKADGKRFKDFSKAEMMEYIEYNRDDVRNTMALYNFFRPMLCTQEMIWQDTVSKMYSEPKLRLDTNVLRAEYDRMQGRIDVALAKVGYTKEDINSPIKFAEILVKLGAELPKKISDRTGKETNAFAKSDLAFQKLMEEGSDDIKAVCEARVNVKGSGQLNRITRLLKLAELGEFSVPLVISGAATGRCGGDEKINLQSLPSGRGDGQTNAIRRSIVAPLGYAIVVGDLSAIEPRCLADMSNDYELLEMYGDGIDPYCILASSMYKIPYEVIKSGCKTDERMSFMRQVGKAGMLQCGYMAGAKGFWVYAQTVAKINITLDEAELVVRTYRRDRYAVVRFWGLVERAMLAMCRGEYGTFGGEKGDLITYDGTWMVGGERVCRMRYADAPWIVYYQLGYELKMTSWGERKPSFYYTGIDPKTKRIGRIYTYSGKVTENMTQSAGGWNNKLASNRCGKFMPIVLSVHDETVGVISIDRAPWAAKEMVKQMEVRPAFSPRLPLTGEAGWGLSYGDAK